jgi:hypothetical protein
MNQSEQAPPGTEYRLRLAVRDEATDGLLAGLTDETTRHVMPGLLYVYSRQSFIHNPTDRYDGFSFTEQQLQMYRRQLSDYNRNAFGLADSMEVDERSVHLKVLLGIEAGRRVFAPPFSDASGQTELDVVYPIFGRKPADAIAIEALRERISTRPRNVVTDLRLVAPKTRQPDTLLITRPRSR